MLWCCGAVVLPFIAGHNSAELHATQMPQHMPAVQLASLVSVNADDATELLGGGLSLGTGAWLVFSCAAEGDAASLMRVFSLREV